MSNEKEIIRIMKSEDGKIVADMMRVFYASPAVLSNGSDEIFKRSYGRKQNRRYISYQEQDICGYKKR